MVKSGWFLLRGINVMENLNILGLAIVIWLSDCGFCQ